MYSSTAFIVGRTERLHRPGLLNEPAGYVDGKNLYEYVRGNPHRNVDPSGQMHVKTNIEFADNTTFIDDLHHGLPGTGTWSYQTDIDSTTLWMNRKIFLAGDRFMTALKFDRNSTSDDDCSYCFDYVTIPGHGGCGAISLGTKKDRGGNARDVQLTSMSLSVLKRNKTQALQLPEIQFLNSIKDKLCKNATIRFVYCGSADLRRQLSNFFVPVTPS